MSKYPVMSAFQLRENRLCTGMSQKDFAAFLKINERTYQRWERGTARLTAAMTEYVCMKVKEWRATHTKGPS